MNEVKVSLSEEDVQRVAQAVASIIGGAPSGLMTIDMVEKFICLKNWKITQMVENGEFPKPRFGGDVRGANRLWRRKDVEAWVDRKVV